MSSERSDVNVRAIFTAGAGLAGISVLIALIVWAFFLFLTREQDRASGRPEFPLAIEAGDRLPPEPRLQTNPRQDLRDLRAAERDLLGSYGWVDRNAGIVRIPIEDAMRITLQRGLPSREQPRVGSR